MTNPQKRDQPLIILGIDPGLAATGYGIISLIDRKVEVQSGGIITTQEGHPLQERLAHLHREVSCILEKHQPQIMAIEGLYSHYRHPNTAILMGHARGVIILSAQRNTLEVAEYPPATIKQAVSGSGRASKEQVRGMVSAMLFIEDEKLSDHVSDALACALTHLIKEDRWP